MNNSAYSATSHNYFVLGEDFSQKKSYLQAQRARHKVTSAQREDDLCLGAIGVLASVCHRQLSRLVMLQCKVLVSKFGTCEQNTSSTRSNLAEASHSSKPQALPLLRKERWTSRLEHTS